MKKFYGLFLALSIFLLVGCSAAVSIVKDGEVKLKEKQGLLVFRVKKYDADSKFGESIEVFAEGEKYFYTIWFDPGTSGEGLKEIYTVRSKNKDYPVLKITSFPEGEYSFSRINLDGNYYVNLPNNSFAVKAGKMIYIGDIVVKSQMEENLLGKSGKFWFKLEDNFSETKRILEINYPTICSNYTLEKGLAQFKPNLVELRDIDTSDVIVKDVKEGENTKDNPIEIIVPFKQGLIYDNTDRANAATLKYLESKHGKEGEGWKLKKVTLLNLVYPDLKDLITLYEIDVISGGKTLDKKYYFKVVFLKENKDKSK